MLVLLALLALGAAAYWVFGRAKAPAAADGPAAKASRAEVVARGDVRTILRETGVVQARQTVAVKSKVPGRVRQLLVAEGDAVTRGQLVAVVEPDAAFALDLSGRRSELARLAIELDQRRREDRRQSRLAEEGLVAAAVAEEAETARRTAETRFSEAKTALNLLESEANQPLTDDPAAGPSSDVTTVRVLAPMAGTVARVAVRPGELATSGTSGLGQEGALLLEIIDASALELQVLANEADVASIAAGQAVEIRLPGAADSGRGHVQRIDLLPKAREDGVVEYPVVIDIEEIPRGLRIGMNADVDIALAEVTDAIRIPTAALSAKGTVRAASAPGTPFADRSVTAGLRGSEWVEITAGVAEGDRVLVPYPDV